MGVKTVKQVNDEFRQSGISKSAWAVAQGLNPLVVYELLAGKTKGERGAAHRAAVLLGLKDGRVVETADLMKAPTHARPKQSVG